MITTIHLLAGAVIGKLIPNFLVVIILALLSHYLLDFIPHYPTHAVKGYVRGLKRINKKDLLIKSLEPIIGISLVIFIGVLHQDKTFFIFLGSFFAWLPDFVQFIGWKFNFPFLLKIVPAPGNIFYNRANSFGWNLIQLFILIGFLVLLLL